MAPIWRSLQRAAAWLLPLPMLRPTMSVGGAEGLAAEAARLQALHAAGVHVPKVLGLSDTLLVTADAGQEFKLFVEALPTDDEKQAWLCKGAEALAALHGAGHAHGRPYVKDFVVAPDGQTIGFLDLEENPVQVMTLEQAQARDIWLYLGSAAQLATYDIARTAAIYAAYAAKAPQAHRSALRSLLRWLAPLYAVLKLLRAQGLGKDVRRAMASTAALLQSL